MFYKQLSNAGLIEGTYTGIAGPNDKQDDLLGVNIPASKFSGAGWSLENSNMDGASGTRFRISTDYDYIEFGADSVSDDADEAILMPEDAWNIDTKIDDGKPGRGRLVARFWDNECANATANTDLDADYLLSNNNVACSLSFLGLFR